MDITRQDPKHISLGEWLAIYTDKYRKIQVSEVQLRLFLNYCVKYYHHQFYFKNDKYGIVGDFVWDNLEPEEQMFERTVFQVLELLSDPKVK